jgi:acetyl esterase/lipase
MKPYRYAAAAAAMLAGACAGHAQTLPPTVTIDPQGTAHIHKGTIPPSNLMSPEALAIILRARPTEGPGALPAPTGTMDQIRRTMNERLQPNVAHMRELFPVDIEETTIDGIAVAIVTPKGGVPKENAGRLVINAPGGGFRTGIRANGLFISIPFAALGRMKVVSLLYRQGPEHLFPAATEDFTKVYRAMLKSYKPANIGFVGCSAGGALVAQTIAALPKAGLPRPAVAGIYCAGANARWMSGDSATFAGLATASTPSRPAERSYFDGMDLGDPAISPSEDPKILAAFPPTIYGTGTRDFAMSQAALSYRRMIALGVESQLMIFDGMGHGFMTNPDFPESRELYAAGVRFFDRHLGR